MSKHPLVEKYGGGEFTRPPSRPEMSLPWVQKELAEHPYYRRSAAYARTLMEPQPPTPRRKR